MWFQEPVQPLSGRDAVEYFSKCYHAGKIKFMYFNIAKNRRYRPYDLVEVPKNKVRYYNIQINFMGIEFFRFSKTIFTA